MCFCLKLYVLLVVLVCRGVNLRRDFLFWVQKLIFKRTFVSSSRHCRILRAHHILTFCFQANMVHTGPGIIFVFLNNTHTQNTGTQWLWFVLTCQSTSSFCAISIWWSLLTYFASSASCRWGSLLLRLPLFPLRFFVFNEHCCLLEPKLLIYRGCCSNWLFLYQLDFILIVKSLIRSKFLLGWLNRRYLTL